MSYSFDIMHDALLLLDGDDAIKDGLKKMVDALHKINHEQTDALNFDDRVRIPAVHLGKRMDELNEEP